MRVVFDTNVLISALLFQKQRGEIEELIKREVVIPCFTQTTLQELRKVLHYPKFDSAYKRLKLSPNDILEALLEKSVIVASPFPIPAVIHDDPSDNHILGCAVEARASFLVSGDAIS